MGTTNSCVCVFWKGRYEVIANTFSNKTTPSYVTFDDEGILVGEASRNQSFDNPRNAIFGIKRIIGRRYVDAEVQKHRKRWPFTVIPLDGVAGIEVEQNGVLNTYSPSQISSHVLMHLIEAAKTFTSQDVVKAVITVPANFTDAQRRATQEAGTLAGLNVVGMINEPTAAALAYGLQQLEADGEQTILVFDFGGGTLDVAILKVSHGGTQFETLATAANMSLGGEDFDEKLLERFVQEFKEKNNGIDLSRFPTAMTSLRLCCDPAKKSLSTMNGLAYVVVNNIHETKHFKTRITRAEFEALSEDVFAKILEPVERALRQARLAKSDIDHIVLVGGCSKMPKVQEIVGNFFVGQSLHRDIHGDEAIAQGAAVYARLLTTDPEHPILDDRGRHAMAIQILESTPHSLGVQLPTGEFAVVVPKGTRIPFRWVRDGTTSKDDQSWVQIKLYEGDSQIVAENEFIGQFRLDGIAPARAGVPKITLTLSSDAMGCLTVTATDERAGRTKQITVNFYR